MACPKVVGCKPVGAQVLVEHLSEQEMMNTSLELVSTGTKRKGEVQQSYVVAVGPGFEPAKWGFDVGDRVMVVGTYNPVPVVADNGRELGIVEPHNIRGVLVEEPVNDPKCCRSESDGCRSESDGCRSESDGCCKCVE